VANTRQGNKIYVDSAGALITTRAKVSYIFFTPDTANDVLILRETATGMDILKIQGSTAKTTLLFDLVHGPLVFQNGIYVQTITSGATATLVLTESGAI